MTVPHEGVGERVHLDLLSDGEAEQAEPAAGWRYVDASDPAVHARVSYGPTSGCSKNQEGASPAPWRCLSGEVTVDVAGSSAPAHLFVVLFPVPQDEQAEFDQWFGSEHAPLLAGALTWSRARLVALEERDRPRDGRTFTRMAVHDLQELSALDSEERRRAGETEWTRQLFQRSWAAGVRRHVLVGRS